MTTSLLLTSTLSFLLVLTHLSHPISSLPVLSFSSTNVSCASPNNSSTCTSCPITLPLTYPTLYTNITCSPIPSYPDSSLYYTYSATSYTQGNLTLYRFLNYSTSPSPSPSPSPCSPSTLITSLSIGNVIQCNNATSSTQTWQFMGGNTTTSTLLSTTSSNASTPFPYTPTPTCSNCTSSVTCPSYVNGTSLSTNTTSYSLLTSVTLTSFCPSTCNPLYLSTFVAFQSSCLSLAGNDSRLQCGCKAGGYIGEVMSNCFISDASSQLLLATSLDVFSGCSPYWQRPSASSSTGLPSPSPSPSSSSSTGTAPSTSSSINEGAIIGGVLGGAVGLVLLILILRCCMRLQAKGHNIEIHRRPKPSPSLEKELEIEGRQLQAERDDMEEDDEDEDEEDDEDDDGDEEEDVEAPTITGGGVPPRK